MMFLLIKRLSICLLLAFLLVEKSFAATVMKGENNASLKVFGEIYADLFYSYANDYSSSDFIRYNQSSTFQLEHTSFLGSYAFIGSSKVGLEFSYKSVSFLAEIGIEEIIRRVYLKYDINKSDKHYFLFGRDYVLDFYNHFNQWSNNLQALNDYGTLKDERRLQMRYGFKGFEVALIIPYLQAPALWAEDNGYYNNNLRNNVFNIIPRINLAYILNKDNFLIKFFAGYGAYYYMAKNEGSLANNASVGLGGGILFTRAIRLDFSLFYSLNGWLNSSLGNYHNPDSFLTPVRISGNLIYLDNIHSLGAALSLSFFTLNGKVVPSIGVGTQATLKPSINKIYREHLPFDISLAAYFNTRIKIAEYFSIIPEIAVLCDLNPMNMPAVPTSPTGISLSVGVMLLAKI